MAAIETGPALDPDPLPGHVDRSATNQRLRSRLPDDLELAGGRLLADRVLAPAKQVAVVSVGHGSVLEHAVIVLNGVPVGRQVDHFFDRGVAVVVLADQVVRDGALLE